MKQEERINKILQVVKSQVQEEVGTLLGTAFVLTTESYDRLSKEDTFTQIQGKQISAEIDITGDITGKGCLLVGIKDAIRLGGTLIMLPDSELTEVIGREEYSEEIEDSYGEIANIIAGAFSKNFEEMYPKACRFVRKNQEKIVPAKVEIKSDVPIEDRQIYRVRWSMELDGHPMGDFLMLLPAATFELEEAIATDASGAEITEIPSQTPEPGVDDSVSAGEPHSQTAQIDFDKQKKRVDRLFDDCQKRLQHEIGGLLGVSVDLSDIRNYFVKKEDFFQERVSGKQVIADVEVVGDVEDKSYFCISLRDAVHLGGVLIMLPPNELENTVNDEEFGDDARDAYGEVANIVAGVYTAVFEEQYSKKCRFIKQGLTEVVPVKVEIASEEPFPETLYYVNSLSLGVDGKELGRVQMLFPAAMLDLLPPELESETSIQQKDASKPVITNEQTEEELATEAAGDRELIEIDATKHKAKVDKLLMQCQQKMQEEVSGLLGTDVVMAHINNKIINKEEFFFDEVSGKQVISNLDVVGDLDGHSFLSVELKDAIRVGGVLIMLPANELEAVVAEEEFSEDAADAFGEVVNIISGVYTAVFEEQYTKKIRFVKKDLQQVTPAKVEVQSEEPIPDQNYYLCSMKLGIGATTFGRVNFLIPLDLLQLEGLLVADVVTENENAAPIGKIRSTTDEGENDQVKRGASERIVPDILIVGDDETTASAIASTMAEMGHNAKTLSFKENIHDYIPGELKAIYLVMNDVNERGFGSAIKISSACTLPLIAVGPEWTRTKVIKAVKYGIRDILMTPASIDEIKQNISNNLLEMAA